MAYLKTTDFQTIDFQTIDFQTTVRDMTPGVYTRLKRAVELGKWPNGQRLKSDQTALCLQAVIAWEQHHLAEEERTGYLAQTCKSAAGNADTEPESASILRFDV